MRPTFSAWADVGQTYVCCLGRSSPFQKAAGRSVSPPRTPNKSIAPPIGQTMDMFIRDFQQCLHKEVPGLKKVSSTEQCGFILDFCLITSRAGTDIDNAIKNLDQVTATKQVIMGVLYPTIDTEKTIPDTNSAIKKENIYFVDFLFNEDIGFMKCLKNNDAIKKLATYIKSKNLTSYCLQNYGNAYQSSYQDGENYITSDQSPLYPSQGDKFSAFLRVLRENALWVGVGVGVGVVVVIIIIVSVI